MSKHINCWFEPHFVIQFNDETKEFEAIVKHWDMKDDVHGGWKNFEDAKKYICNFRNYDHPSMTVTGAE